MLPLNLWRWQMSSFSLWADYTKNQLTSHYTWVNPKTTTCVQSKLSMWHNIVDFNMNKRSSWNNQATIQTSVIGETNTLEKSQPVKVQEKKTPHNTNLAQISRMIPTRLFPICITHNTLQSSAFWISSATNHISVDDNFLEHTMVKIKIQSIIITARSSKNEHK